MVKETVERAKSASAVEEIAIDKFDHVEFFVGNALQACYYYHHGFGFNVVAFRGLETGSRDSVSYVMKQNGVTIVLTGTLTRDSDVAEHVHTHGDGVKTIGFQVRDVEKAYNTAVERGARSHTPPVHTKDENGEYSYAIVHTYGETLHKFIDRKNYSGHFAPGFMPLDNKSKEECGLMSIDHIVGNVEVDKMEEWVDFYERVFGFYVYQYFDADDISTQYSSLVSKVMANKTGSIKLPINEPAMGLRKSQIQEYLDYYHAGGVQHIAITTRDIIKSVEQLQKRGIKFLTVPQSYYDELTERVGEIDEDLTELARLGILVDRESDGYLLQIFTKPVEDRPTLFFEVIQRKGAKGFG
ncbi:MAG: 4-hydroxyphenylpyruvate dioxygenase, partial [Cyanobacteria bacterium]|nr:4-hydroxyphenylpyruvate dioxygenase [Cyanobacteriota bacterium]